MCLFTDGSCIEDSQYADFAVVSYDGSISEGYKCADFVSSYCVEAIAILMALELEYNWLKLTIFSDSKSILSAVSAQFDHRDKLHFILFIKDNILHLTRDKVEVKFIWIPSHIGISGNEQANRLAREAIAEICNWEFQYLIFKFMKSTDVQ